MQADRQFPEYVVEMTKLGDEFVKRRMPGQLAFASLDGNRQPLQGNGCPMRRVFTRPFEIKFCRQVKKKSRPEMIR